MDRTRTLFRYLRIATTALCLVMCGLLIALWVRSYWWENCICLHRPNSNDLCCTTFMGQFYVEWGEDPFSDIGDFGIANEWSFENNNIKQKWSDELIADQDFVRGFSFYIDSERVSVSLPQWSLAALAAVLAAVPWIRWRFSLRTLLIGMTLVAVVCGAIAMM